MIDVNWNPSPRQLRTFGLGFLVASSALAAIFAWRAGGAGTVTWVLAGLGAAVAFTALVAPRLLKPLFLGLTIAAYPIGLVIGTVLLGITYYLVVTGVGLVFRLFGKDPMHRRFDPDAASYWVARKRPESAARYFRQF